MRALAERGVDAPVYRQLADQAFSRAAGAPLVRGNAVRLLKDAAANYPAWLEAIRGARRQVHFESYIIHADAAGARFADALIEKAREGVPVRLVYDWLGAVGTHMRRLRPRMQKGGVEVRCFNRPRFSEPFGWLSRDHRKCLVVDDEIAFVSGLCVGAAWEGDPERGIAPWRDTGLEIRGPAVAEVARAFADTWAACGEPLPLAPDGGPPPDPPVTAAVGPAGPFGEVALRVVATTAGTAGLYRLDTLIAALARTNLWLTDAYYAGTPSYVQALRSAARDGVDVRLLVPGSGTDLGLVQAISRAGYRPLLDAGVRVFEWNGPMVHAKTAVADGRWARVGSSNLNLASWMGNWELDAVVEDDGFARAMEDMYRDDLANATEIVLESRSRLRLAGEKQKTPRRASRARGGRAAASALRIGNAIGSALAARRVHGPAERRLLLQGGSALVVVAALALVWPRLVAWPLGVLCLWLAVALLLRARRRV